MRARNRLAAAMLLCGAALAPALAMAKGPAMAGDCFLAGVKAGDADALAACYAEDAVMWFPGGPMAKGRAAIHDAYAGMLTHVTIKDAVLSQIGEAGMGDTHATWGTYAITMVDKTTGAETVERGRYTDVQKKIGGKWQYIVDHPSDDPAPAAAAK